MKKLFELFYQCNGISTDTRNIDKDTLFIALKGDNFNGNKFAAEAIEKGAKYAIVDEVINKDTNHPNIFCVNNSLKYLQQLANYHRSKFNIPIIGITGSNGKTTSKELIATVLSKKFKLLYTKGNLNNHIGVPLSLLKLNKEHELAIIEMGASKLGDIKELTDIANPTHGIITNIGVAHIEGFGSEENILKTKTELYHAIQENNGVLFYNEDDNILEENLPTGVTTYSYGTKEATITGVLEKMIPEVVLSWKNKDYQSNKLTTKIIGKYNFYNLLAAICIGNYFNLSPELINQGVCEYESTNNRSQIKKTKNNTVILDAYNANPTSVSSALESFAMMKHENKLVILGDMLELGNIAKEAHQKIINETKSLKLQTIFIGETFSSFSEKEKNHLFFKTTQEAKDFLTIDKPKDKLILLKGSRSIGLEQLSELF